jgi:O-antigen ligase
MNTIKVGAEQTEGSAKQRMTLLIGAYHASLDHPVFGLGPGGWLEVAEAYTGDTHNPHNIYLVLSSETGIPGLLIYLIVVVFTAVRVSRVTRLALKRGDLEWARLGSALTTSIFGLLSAMTFLNRPFNEYLWGWMCIANALPAIYAREARRPASAPAGAPAPRPMHRGRPKWIRPPSWGPAGPKPEAGEGAA